MATVSYHADISIKFFRNRNVFKKISYKEIGEKYLHTGCPSFQDRAMAVYGEESLKRLIAFDASNDMYEKIYNQSFKKMELTIKKEYKFSYEDFKIEVTLERYEENV